MKRVISFILLIVGLVGILGITAYTLCHRGIREEESENITRKIEKATSNLTGDMLSEMYNVSFNQEKHKVKLDYKTNTLDDGVNVSLQIYFDGDLVLEENVFKVLEVMQSRDIFQSENFVNLVKLNEDSFKFINSDKIDYLLFNIGYYDVFLKNKYFILNSQGEMLISEGIVLKDSSAYYVKDDDSELDIFYDNNQIMAKIDMDEIYALEPVNNKKKLQILEYKYYFSEGKIEKKLINTYNKIKIKENNIDKEL